MSSIKIWASQEPANVDLLTIRDASWSETLTITDDESGDPLDLTDYDAELLVAEDDSGGQLLKLTTGHGLTLGGEAGTVAFGEKRGSLPLGYYKFSLWLIAKDGTRDQYLWGQFVVIATPMEPVA